MIGFTADFSISRLFIITQKTADCKCFFAPPHQEFGDIIFFTFFSACLRGIMI